MLKELDNTSKIRPKPSWKGTGFFLIRTNSATVSSNVIDVTPGFLSVPFGAYVAVAKASRIELGRADTGALGPVGGIASFLGRTVFQAFAFYEMTKRIANVHMERQGILKKTKKM